MKKHAKKTQDDLGARVEEFGRRLDAHETRRYGSASARTRATRSLRTDATHLQIEVQAAKDAAAAELKGAHARGREELVQLHEDGKQQVAKNLVTWVEDDELAHLSMPLTEAQVREGLRLRDVDPEKILHGTLTGMMTLEKLIKDSGGRRVVKDAELEQFLAFAPALILDPRIQRWVIGAMRRRVEGAESGNARRSLDDLLVREYTDLETRAHGSKKQGRAAAGRALSFLFGAERKKTVAGSGRDYGELVRTRMKRAKKPQP